MINEELKREANEAIGRMKAEGIELTVFQKQRIYNVLTLAYMEGRNSLLREQYRAIR